MDKRGGTDSWFQKKKEKLGLPTKSGTWGVLNSGDTACRTGIGEGRSLFQQDQKPGFRGGLCPFNVKGSEVRVKISESEQY